MLKTTSLYDILLKRTARVPLTLLLIAGNLIVFGLMLNAGAGLLHSNNGVQLAWGANFGPATQDGQWWRLGSALFLHFGLIHIVMNLWALWDGGQLVERIYGHLRFILIYFTSGLFGNLLSLVVQGNEAVSGGASGAIFGIYGALLVFIWRERKQLDPREFRWLFWGGSVFTAGSIALGLFVPGIDNSAHIGGLVAGMLVGTLLGRPVLGETPWPPAQRGVCALLLLGATFFLLTHIPAASYRWSEEIAAREEIRSFLERESQVQKNWQDIIREDRLNAASFEDLAKRIEFEITEHYEESFEDFSELTLSASAPSAAQVESLRRYSEQRRNASQALANKLRTDSQFGPARTIRPAPAPPGTGAIT
jgi:rhomboid protease GluP